MDPLISVIVPVYNVENYLPRCLQAISEQTYQNLEIILVDDGSTDRSGILCDDFAAKDARARVIHQPNTGLWAARNAGHDAANGDLLFFPDGDDYFHRDCLRLLQEAINSRDGYDLAICQMKKTERLDEDVNSPRLAKYASVSQNELLQCLFLKYTNPLGVFSHNVWNKLFRRQFLANHRHNPYPIAQDRDFLIRLYLKNPKAILVSDVLYYWVQRSTSLMHSPSYPLRRLACLSRMDYAIYLSMTKEQKPFAHLLLEDLYVEMLFWKSSVWASMEHTVVFNECNSILKDTQKSFLFCQEIPLWKRLFCLLLAHCPRLSQWLVRLSGNLP